MMLLELDIPTHSPSQRMWLSSITSLNRDIYCQVDWIGYLIADVKRIFSKILGNTGLKLRGQKPGGILSLLSTPSVSRKGRPVSWHGLGTSIND